MKARFYIYRNLNKQDYFSIRLRGKVIDWQRVFCAKNVKLQVSEAGNQRAINNKQRNVHAYAVCDTYQTQVPSDTCNLRKVSYNPFKGAFFYWSDTGLPVDFLSLALFKYGELYGRC